MSGIHRRQLSDGTDIVWTVPLSGMGHVADEQPLPYLQRHGIELTPRYGGEEQNLQSGLLSLPLPYGYVASGWPWRQRLFNLTRRRINIYWRNFLKDFNHNDGLFHLLEQLDYHETKDGFHGYSPCLTFQRTFVFYSNGIDVRDRLNFKCNIHFSELHLCPWVDFVYPAQKKFLSIKPTMPANYQKQIKSSTGIAVLNFHTTSDVTFLKGDSCSWDISYRLNDGSGDNYA